jgi:CHAD domain-containing protein
LSNLEELHRFRIEGKRLRYALELFAGPLGDAVRDDLYPAVEELQEQLGAVNDHANAARRFEAWISDSSGDSLLAALRCWRDEECKLLRDAHQRFLQEWTAERVVALRDRFERVLVPSKLHAR